MIKDSRRVFDTNNGNREVLAMQVGDAYIGATGGMQLIAPCLCVYRKLLAGMYAPKKV